MKKGNKDRKSGQEMSVRSDGSGDESLYAVFGAEEAAYGTIGREENGERTVNDHVFRGPYRSTNPCPIYGAWEDEALDVNCQGQEGE
jgi:hypothetical protein